MDYLRRPARVSRLKKIPNTASRNKIQAEQSILDRIQRRQLKWYGHLLKIGEEGLPVDNALQEEKWKTATIMEEPSDGLYEKLW